MIHLRLLLHLPNPDLSKTRIADAGSAYLRAVLNLAHLQLYRYNITGTELAHLRALTCLTDLAWRSVETS